VRLQLARHCAGTASANSNAVVAAAVKHRKELSRTVRDADAETFEVVVV
jgi:hypothetical protein